MGLPIRLSASSVPKGGSQCFVQEEGAHAAPLITARKHVYFVAHSWNVLLLLFGAAPGSFFRLGGAWTCVCASFSMRFYNVFGRMNLECVRVYYVSGSA